MKDIQAVMDRSKDFIDPKKDAIMRFIQSKIDALRTIVNCE